MAAAEEQLLVEAVAAGVEGGSAFPLVIGGFGAFPNARRPRVVWLGLREGAAPLIALQRHVEDEVLRRALVLDSEEFTPHLTPARVRPEAGPAAPAAPRPTPAALPTPQQGRSTAPPRGPGHS